MADGCRVLFLMSKHVLIMSRAELDTVITHDVAYVTTNPSDRRTLGTHTPDHTR
jgi:hypothetical protein